MASEAPLFAGLVEKSLADLKARYRVGESRPVPVEEIAEAEGGRIIRRFMIADAALSYPKRGRGFRVAVNSAHPEVRQRFSIGHELGHVIIDRMEEGSQSASRSCKVLPDATHMEIERTCNRFSAGLLIPDEVVMWLADWGVLSIESLRQTADQWSVSLPALAWYVLEESPGDGGLISLRWSSAGTRGGRSRLVVEWALFPNAKGLFLRPGLPIVSTALLREMLTCVEEKLFVDALLPLPGFQTERNVRALGTQTGLQLLVSPASPGRG